MLAFCRKNRGAISVFLTLILIPTFIFSGVLVDGSKILGAKNLVSGAGELALNGALSNYNEELNKTYGLLAMATTAEEVESAMQDFFKATLNYSGLREEDVSKALVYLELTSDSFSVSNIPGSEIFRTEVLEQEVLEYMKYRAPVTLVGRVIDNGKLDQLVNMEKERKAADGQLKFEKELDDLQDIFDELKELTDKLHDEVYNEICDKSGYDSMLSYAQVSYKEATMLGAAYYLMNAARFEAKGGDTKALMEEMVGLKWSGSIDAENASKIIQMIVIDNSVADPESVLDGVDEDSEEYEELLELIENYADAQTNMENGYSATRDRLESVVRNVYEEVKKQYDLAGDGLDLCETIDKKVEELEKKFKKMKESYDKWDKAVQDLPDGESKSAYEENLKEFDYFESEGMLDSFKSLIEDNKTYFTEVRDQLDDLTFAEKPLHQINDRSVITNQISCDFVYSANEITTEGQNLMGLYHDIGTMNLSIENKNIDLQNPALKGHEFVEKLEEYCDTSGANKAKQDEATNTWKSNMEAASGSLKTMMLSDDIDNFEFSNYDLPSDWLSIAYDDEGADDLTVEGGLDKSDRKKAYNSGDQNLNKDSAGISEISGLPALLAQAGETVAEPLIITEYVMGMFSHYTSNYDGYKNTTDNPLSITDDELKAHAAYRAEIEYILWGQPKARDNVTITKSIIFAVNMVFNLGFAFTNSTIRSDATTIASFFPVGALAKIAIKCALQTMVAMVETVRNMAVILEGGAVPLIKYGASPTWDTNIMTTVGHKNDGKSGFTYEDYVWILVCVKMFASRQTVLARTADCIELNMTDKKTNDDNSLKDMYTMIDLEASVSIDTFFLPKLNGAGYDVQTIDDDTFTIDYYGVQGY